MVDLKSVFHSSVQFTRSAAWPPPHLWCRKVRGCGCPLASRGGGKPSQHACAQGSRQPLLRGERSAQPGSRCWFAAVQGERGAAARSSAPVARGTETSVGGSHRSALSRAHQRQGEGDGTRAAAEARAGSPLAQRPAAAAAAASRAGSGTAGEVRTLAASRAVAGAMRRIEPGAEKLEGDRPLHLLPGALRTLPASLVASSPGGK